MLRRMLYFIYYLKHLNLNTFLKFYKYVKEHQDVSGPKIILSMIYHSHKYNISILEYFQFGFYKKSHEEKNAYAGTGFMYEYQLKMNPKGKRIILDDKRRFYKQYKRFFVHKVYSVEELRKDTSLLAQLLNNSTGKVVLKLSNGKCGAQVEIKETKDFTPPSLLEYMDNNEYDMAEEFVKQHEALNELSTSAVNTVRIFTQLNNQIEVDILGCRLRISVDCNVDNLAAGNLAAPIDEKTGIVNGNGIYSDITKSEMEYHPITHIRIRGFQIPFWDETIKLAKEAALLHIENRSIGWDIVITDKGPGLIEGNHDWCKLLWQLPVKKGLKNTLDKYLDV